ncbi:MAG: 4-hydroxythreonine-4-phosphate dehydrogenase PdxA [Deltaproteobacteria bacterium]|nr:4-hydroxythreonine-4-phosphate dehydrogenase PdxA [Deltaproteobacteria bacterium]
MHPLLLTMGDPTGIGPELIVKALLEGAFESLRHPVQVIGDVELLTRAGEIFDIAATSVPLEHNLYSINFGRQQLTVYSCSELDEHSVVYGHPDPSCGQAMAEYIEYAVTSCLNGSAAGIVTCPINKAAINAAGYHFPGHTELLAQRCGIDKVVMMLAGQKLKVCLVTTHLPYRAVPAQLTGAEISATLQITAAALKEHFGINSPHLAVLALNPHAGEDGLFGDEEQRIIAPAIAQAQREGINADGPHSADTLFHFAAKGRYDAVICMYHDQGLIPLKLLHFDDAVNVTLGLPIIRTSVDHGTAYDLAGTGKANTASLGAALNMADQMATHRHKLSSSALD